MYFRVDTRELLAEVVFLGLRVVSGCRGNAVL